MGAGVLKIRAQVLTGDGQVHLAGTTQHVCHIRRGVEISREINAWKVVAIAIGVLNLASYFSTPGPQSNVGACIREDFRERGAPGTCSQHGEVSHRVSFDPVPSCRVFGGVSPRSEPTNAAISCIKASVASSRSSLVRGFP